MSPANPVRRPAAVRSEPLRSCGRFVRRRRTAILRGKRLTVDESELRFETLAYDSWRETRMAGAAEADGIHSGVGRVFERDHRNAHRYSRARSDHAESCGPKCFRSEPDTAVARVGAARGGPHLQRPAD